MKLKTRSFEDAGYAKLHRCGIILDGVVASVLAYVLDSILLISFLSAFTQQHQQHAIIVEAK